MTKISPAVLLVSNRYDFSTDFICVELNEQKIPYWRMNRDELEEYVINFDPVNCVLTATYKDILVENEANCFATEFLMPQRLFVPNVENKGLSLSLIKEVSSYFRTSILATFLRYVDYGKFPLMVIFIENGIIKWRKESDDFPFKWIPKDSKLPVLTVAGDLFYNNLKDNEPQLVDAVEWFSEDGAIHKKADWKLWEQCYKVSPTGIVSCLWTY